MNLANKRLRESNFGLMVHEVVKAQNLVFYQPTIYLMFLLIMCSVNQISNMATKNSSVPGNGAKNLLMTNKCPKHSLHTRDLACL